MIPVVPVDNPQQPQPIVPVEIPTQPESNHPDSSIPESSIPADRRECEALTLKDDWTNCHEYDDCDAPVPATGNRRAGTVWDFCPCACWLSKYISTSTLYFI